VFSTIPGAVTLDLLTRLTPGVAHAGEGERFNVFGHTLIFKHSPGELNGAAFLWELSSPPGA
jgi:hypothetical protein